MMRQVRRDMAESQGHQGWTATTKASLEDRQPLLGLTPKTDRYRQGRHGGQTATARADTKDRKAATTILGRMRRIYPDSQ